MCTHAYMNERLYVGALERIFLIDFQKLTTTEIL